jgi:hypothetical protein
MRRRGSIARLMLAIGLSALALTLLRGWLGRINMFGFFGLMALMVLVALVVALITAGPIRRFFAGAAATGSVLWVAILIAPSAILDSYLNHLIIPVTRRIGPNPASSGLTQFELRLLWAELGQGPSGTKVPARPPGSAAEPGSTVAPLRFRFCYLSRRPSWPPSVD